MLSEAMKRTKVNKHGFMCHLHVDDSHIPTWVSSLRSRLSVYLFTPLGNLTGISHLTRPNRAIGFPVPNAFPHASLPHLSNGTTISLVALGAQLDPFLSLNPHILVFNKPSGSTAKQTSELTLVPSPLSARTHHPLYTSITATASYLVSSSLLPL